MTWVGVKVTIYRCDGDMGRCDGDPWVGVMVTITTSSITGIQRQP